MRYKRDETKRAKGKVKLAPQLAVAMRIHESRERTRDQLVQLSSLTLADKRLLMRANAQDGDGEAEEAKERPMPNRLYSRDERKSQ